MIWALDIATKQFLYVNEKAQELLGFPVEKWLETPTFWADRIYAEDRDWMLRGYDQSIESWARHHCEYRANTSYGKIVWLRESARILQDEAGQPRHLIGLAIDVTQQRLLEAQYVQAQTVEAASRLASRTAHEIANQVMIISGYAEDLLTTLEPSSPMRADVREISAATNRLRTLMGQLSSSLEDSGAFRRPHRPERFPEESGAGNSSKFGSFPAPGSQDLPRSQWPCAPAVVNCGRFLWRWSSEPAASQEGGQISIESPPVEIEAMLESPDPTLPGRASMRC